MRALVQRVSEARVGVDGDIVGEIGPGLCVFVGVTHTDDGSVAWRLATKVWNLRIFDDATGRMSCSLGRDWGRGSCGEPVHFVRRYLQGAQAELVCRCSS